MRRVRHNGHVVGHAPRVKRTKGVVEMFSEFIVLPYCVGQPTLMPKLRPRTLHTSISTWRKPHRRIHFYTNASSRERVLHQVHRRLGGTVQKIVSDLFHRVEWHVVMHSPAGQDGNLLH